MEFILIPCLPLGPKYSPLFCGREREKRPLMSGVAKVFFFCSPTTSLLPPSESFRTEQRPFTGEPLRGKRRN